MGIAARSASQVTLVTVVLATVRDASVMHVARQAVYAMTSLENVLVNLEWLVNSVLVVRFAYHSFLYPHVSRPIQVFECSPFQCFNAVSS